MTKLVQRNYLEIKSIQDLNEAIKPNGDYSLNLLEPINFQLNKFFYKNIGKKHKWIDRLAWSEEKWISYVSSINVNTYVFFQYFCKKIYLIENQLDQLNLTNNLQLVYCLL